MGEWKEIFCLFLLLCVLIFFGSFLTGAKGAEVQHKGRILKVRNDGKGLYSTIQSAIDAAEDGDEVVVGEGLYWGEGNRNLNFHGKSIRVRSEEPEVDECVRSTIIDAEGSGAIVRFVNDEGPGSVFEGFTLFGGDAIEAVRGVAGFFEFSSDARPTTRRLRIQGGEEEVLTSSDVPLLQQAQTRVPYDGRLWRGNNPFTQPAMTTDYYGSGDVDLDGVLTQSDVDMAQAIVSGIEPKVSRADVDGDGDIDSLDVSSISSAISGGILNSWWDQLGSRSQRNSWVSKILSIDKTDKHTYDYWYQCLGFGLQTFINTTFYRGDLFHTVYDGGPSRFNVPMYYVSLTAPAFGHGINAILVGDNPLDFGDWRFIEPQTDGTVTPGMWDMPYGSTLILKSVSFISQTGTFSGSGSKVTFYVDETGWSLVDYDTKLVLAYPGPSGGIIDNRSDAWDPHIAARDSGELLFERCRDDMLRTTEINLGDLSFGEAPTGKRLICSSKSNHILDVCKGPDGTIHLLWKGESSDVPGVFYGYILSQEDFIRGKSRVSSGVRMVRMGRVVVTDTNNIHVFWLEQNSNSSHSYGSGIYWRKKTTSGWQSAVNVAPYPDFLIGSFYWDNPDKLRYYFDAVSKEQNHITLVWVEPVFGAAESDLCQRVYSQGNWGAVDVIETDNILGVDLVRDSSNILHMAYWLTDGSWSYNRGNLVHRKSEDGLLWSLPETIDPSGEASSPHMCATDDGEVYLIWERRISGTSVPVWSIYENDMWSCGYLLSTREGSNAWYPKVASLDTGQVLAAWSSRSSDWVTVEKRTDLLIGDFDGDSDIDIGDLDVLCSEWLGGGMLISDIAPLGSCDGKVDMFDYTKFAEYMAVP
ncbi:MAG: dockerin type I repeat-containing protein [Planctomycetota bacterium]|jgi:hypothetical protein